MNEITSWMVDLNQSSSIWPSPSWEVDLTCRLADICPVRQLFNCPSTQLFNWRDQILNVIATDSGNPQSTKGDETL
jgi:hypothetical protein